MFRKEDNLKKSIILSATVHCVVAVLGFFNIFVPRINDDLFMNIEIAGAAEMQQALDEYQKEQLISEENYNEKIEESIQENQEIVSEPVVESNTPEPIPEFSPVEQPELVNEIIPQPSIEPSQEVISVPEPIMEEQSATAEGIPEEAKADEDALMKQEEEKKRLEKEKRLKEEKEKKKKEAQLRRKKRLEAIKRIEKKKEDKKKRLAKIAEAAKKKKDSDFSNMLKKEKTNLKKSADNKKKNAIRINGNGMGHGNGLGSYGDGYGITDSDAAIISSQVIPHWVVAGGVKNAETLIIRIHIKLKDNGEVIPSSIEILDQDRYNSDYVFRSAADSAKRAILAASPFKIPADKIHLFRDFEFSFNTDKALGG